MWGLNSFNVCRHHIQQRRQVCAQCGITWQASSLCCTMNSSSSPSGSTLLNKASNSSSTLPSWPQLSSHQVHFYSRSNQKHTYMYFNFSDMWAQTLNTEFSPQETSHLGMYELLWPSANAALQTWSIVWKAASCSRACCCSALALTSSGTHSSSWHLSVSGSLWNRCCTNANWDPRTCSSF